MATQNLRPTRITHTLTAGSRTDKWMVDVEFAADAAAAAPINVPPPPGPSTVANDPKADTAWIDLFADTTSWRHYPGEERCQFRRLNGIVYVRGIVQRLGAGGQTDAWGFLPAGFRPKIGPGTNGWTQQMVSVNGTPRVMYIRNDGAMYLPDSAPGNGGYVFLNDVRPFPADA